MLSSFVLFNFVLSSSLVVGIKLYHVKWKGAPGQRCEWTWEPRTSLVACKHVWEEYTASCGTGSVTSSDEDEGGSSSPSPEDEDSSSDSDAPLASKRRRLR